MLSGWTAGQPDSWTAGQLDSWTAGQLDMNVCFTVSSTEPEDVDVAVRSSTSENVMQEGGEVTLTCTADCSFHQLDVKWYKDGQALSETGPALHLRHLTIHHAGKYTCSLDTSSSEERPCLGVWWWRQISMRQMSVSPSVFTYAPDDCGS